MAGSGRVSARVPVSPAPTKASAETRPASATRLLRDPATADGVRTTPEDAVTEGPGRGAHLVEQLGLRGASDDTYKPGQSLSECRDFRGFQSPHPVLCGPGPLSFADADSIRILPAVDP